MSNDGRGVSQMMLYTLDHELEKAVALAKADPSEIFKVSTLGNLSGLNWLHLVAHSTTTRFGRSALEVEAPTS